MSKSDKEESEYSEYETTPEFQKEKDYY